MEVAHGEMVEAELNRLIEKRSSREVDPDERGEAWKESVRRYNARQQEENRQAWHEYHRAKKRWEEFLAANREVRESRSMEHVLARGLTEHALSSEQPSGISG